MKIKNRFISKIMALLMTVMIVISNYAVNVHADEYNEYTTSGQGVNYTFYAHGTPSGGSGTGDTQNNRSSQGGDSSAKSQATLQNERSNAGFGDFVANELSSPFPATTYVYTGGGNNIGRIIVYEDQYTTIEALKDAIDKYPFNPSGQGNYTGTASIDHSLVNTDNADLATDILEAAANGNPNNGRRGDEAERKSSVRSIPIKYIKPSGSTQSTYWNAGKNGVFWDDMAILEEKNNAGTLTADEQQRYSAGLNAPSYLSSTDYDSWISHAVNERDLVFDSAYPFYLYDSYTMDERYKTVDEYLDWMTDGTIGEVNDYSRGEGADPYNPYDQYNPGSGPGNEGGSSGNDNSGNNGGSSGGDNDNNGDDNKPGDGGNNPEPGNNDDNNGNDGGGGGSDSGNGNNGSGSNSRDNGSPKNSRNVGITDKIRIQHIIEYKISSIQKNIVYSISNLKYSSAPQTYYRWSIEYVDVNGAEPHFVTQRQNHPIGYDERFTWPFDLTGTYVIRAKTNREQTVSESLTYNMNEFWVIADTGQVIYSNVRNGVFGGIQEDGRLNDVNTVYYHFVRSIIPSNFTADGLAGTVIYAYKHIVTEVSNYMPPTGINTNFNTYRIE